MSNTIVEIQKLTKEQIIRPNYGETSLKSWEPEFDKMNQKFDFILKYWSQVDSQTNKNVQTALNQIHSQLQQLIGFSEAQFVSNKQQVTTQINQQISIIKQYWPHYISAAIEGTGLLTNVDLKKEFLALTSNLKEKTTEALLKIEAESQAIINKTMEIADDIESTARKTAQKISVGEAQEQFRLAEQNNLRSIKIWGGITIFFVLAFTISIICMLAIDLPDKWTWQIIYYSALRATAIGFIGTLLAFSLKMLKSHLHMREHNLHRQRIANSMASFAESAMNKEQRDIILSRLVDSVATFGNSGMLGNEDDSGSKITIDNITRTLGAIKSGGN